ncbi:MAG: PTS sugar transporter subunit IIA [Tatlockia sp.]|nr:PTS sugar transporter subunit IIA [Tatlockia sp.]
MQLRHLIKLNSVHIDSVSQSKTAVLLKISQLLSQQHCELDYQKLFDAYWTREALGSTAIGQGITIPHIRHANIAKPLACVIKLLNPVDFGAKDKQPIDLVIGLIAPLTQVDQHLQILATIIKQFSNPSVREACRSVIDREVLYKILIAEEIHKEEMVLTL